MIWFAGRWRNHQPKRAEKPHSKFSDRKALDGPATRPKTPFAVENGVGKPAAPREGARLMPVRERELGTLPSPICPCLAERPGRDLMFLAPVSISLNFEGVAAAWILSQGQSLGLASSCDCNSLSRLCASRNCCGVNSCFSRSRLWTASGLTLAAMLNHAYASAASLATPSPL